MERPPFSVLRELMESVGFEPSRALGQNFLLDPSLLEAIAADAELDSRTMVLEIGTGLGFLTSVLARRARGVVSIEIDRRLHELAKELSAEWSGHFELLCGDALAPGDRLHEELLGRVLAHGPNYVVVSNLPYAVAGPAIASLVAAEPPPRRMVLLCQMELVDRVLAAPGSRDFGTLSASTQLLYSGRRTRKVPAPAFRPRPKVQSAVMRLDLRTPLVGPRGDTVRGFGAFLRGLFGARRKTLRNALRQLGHAEAAVAAALERASLASVARPETCTPQALFVLWQSLAAASA